jgi:hypothetical protein
MAKWLDSYKDTPANAVQSSLPSHKIGDSVTWGSPRFGHRWGRVVLLSEDGWQITLNEKTGGLTWVREDRCESCVS